MLDNHVTYVDCTEDAVIVVFNIDKILSMCTWCVCLLYRCCVCKVNVSCVCMVTCVCLCVHGVCCALCVYCVVLCIHGACVSCVYVVSVPFGVCTWCVHGVCLVSTSRDNI